MKTSYAAVLLLILFGVSASAQIVQNPFYPEPLADLKAFLQLTDVQLTTILMNNNDYNRWSMDKQNRIRQVQSEIADEMAKEDLDPGAIGIRYAEIEAICRDMAAHAADSRTKNVQVLTDPQRTKLKVLEDAMKLQPTIAQAQSGNLLGSPNVAPAAFAGVGLGIVTGTVSGSFVGSAYGCYQPMSLVPALRTGDFSAFPNGN